MLSRTSTARSPSKPAVVARAAWPTSRGRGLRITRRIRHRWSDLFDLVLDLERYPEFVPNCRAVKVFSSKLVPDPLALAGEGREGARTVIVSRMTVGVAMVEVGYANRTTGDRASRRIAVEAIDGPLRHLDVLWTFEPDGEDSTQVGFSVDYEFSSPMLSAVASRVFDAMFADILVAFERRADSVINSASQ